MALRLLKLVNRRVKDRTYLHWRIGDIPPEVVERLGWEEGVELELVVRGGTLLLKPKS